MFNNKIYIMEIITMESKKRNLKKLNEDSNKKICLLDTKKQKKSDYRYAQNKKYESWIYDVQINCNNLIDKKYNNEINNVIEKANLYQKFLNNDSVSKVSRELIDIVTRDYNIWLDELDRFTEKFVGTKRYELIDIDAYNFYKLGFRPEGVAKKIYKNSFSEWHQNIWKSLKNMNVPISFFLNKNIQNKIKQQFNSFSSFAFTKTLIQIMYAFSDKRTNKNSVLIDKLIESVTLLNVYDLPKELFSDYLYSLNLNTLNFKEIKQRVEEKWFYCLNILGELSELCSNSKHYNFYDVNILDFELINSHFKNNINVNKISRYMYTNEWKKKIEKDFNNWMKDVNELVTNETNYCLLDLPDERYRDYFDEGFTPEKMTNTVTHNLKEFISFLLNIKKIKINFI